MIFSKGEEMKKVTLIVALSFSLCVAAGCGPDDNGNNGGGNNGGGEISAENFAQQFPQAYAEAACKSAFQCPENQSPVITTLLFGRTPTEADCVAEFQQDGGDFVALGDVESGLIDFDPQAAQDCLDELEQRAAGSACDAALAAEAAPQSCYDAAQGTLADGETCATDEQCQSGACDETAIENACTGQCAPRADEGEECDPSTGGDGPQCRPSLTCVPGDGGGFECAQMGTLNEGDDCALSFSSITACGGGLQCAGEQGTGTCTAVTYVGDGEDCTADLTYCQPGLVCIEGACATAGVAGDACMSTNLECQVGFYCDSDAGECTAVKQAGDACDRDSQCGDLECVEGTCQQPEACTLPTN
jgi:hypothetical protein